MANPFSIITSTIGLLDVCYRVGSYLGDVKHAAKTIEKDLEGLREEIAALHSINTLIQELEEKTEKAGLVSSLDQEPELQRIWNNIGENTRGCKDVIESLEDEVKQIMGKTDQTKPKGKIDGIRKTMKMQSADQRLARFHDSLSKYHQSSQMSLTALDIFYTRHSLKATDDLSGKADKLLEKESQLEYQIKVLRAQLRATGSSEFLETIDSAAAVIAKPLNKHFMPPRSLSSIFTGREELLHELGQILEEGSSDDGSNVQKRFVVQGLGGAGKTEFCCKFAQVNRQKFWGVFSINATSRQTAKEGFAAIAMIGGVEPNQRAAKTWLSSLEVPWLLIIDNADDPFLDIEEFFPEGERGFILVTTRVPTNVKHGTVGPGYFEFEKLESHAATHLLLKAAQWKGAWDSTTMDRAGLITKALGYLPLALIHAGSAIANHLCELGNYLDYFEAFWETIRQAKKDARTRKRSNSDASESSDDDTYMNVYSSYEILYKKLEQGSLEKNDAVELLKIFAFFNRENIRLDYLIAASKNCGREIAAEKKMPQKSKKSKPRIVENTKPKSWTQMFRELLFALRTEVVKDRSPPILPMMLRDVLDGSLPITKFEFRLRKAMLVLTQWSLVTYHEPSKSYSMHPLVHVWVRERPQMTLGEQAIWAQAASNTIGHTISLPEAGTPSAEEMEFHRSLLLHIIMLRQQKREIVRKIRQNQTRYWRLWPLVEPKSDLEVVNRIQAMQCAKLSYVYFICGNWNEALELQEAVKDFLVPNLGFEHPSSIRICRFLARTYFLKGRFNDAGALNEQVLEAAIKSLGEEHETTLQIMDSLGSIRNLQGRFPEAENIFSRAIERMIHKLGSNHQDTLCAVDNLGSVYWHMFAFDKAVDLHLQAVEGLKIKMGPTHERTLSAKENLAMAYRELGGAFLDTAHELMEEVLKERTIILGREQPYTLIAMLNLAYIKHAMGDHKEAEEIINKGMPIAERNLGETHTGVLSAKLRLAEILTAQQRYEEAKALFRFLLDRNNYADKIRTEGAIKGDHKDRIWTLYQYVLFWEHQGRIKEALDTCEELCVLLESSTHVIRKMAFDKREDLMRRYAFPL